jgi:hypothetical protein
MLMPENVAAGETDACHIHSPGGETIADVITTA